MSNWDDDDWDATPSSSVPAVGVPLSSALGDWDDEDESEDEVLVLKKQSAPMKPSKIRALALKEKEEAERSREIERILSREKEVKELSVVERKLRQQQLVEDADLENTKDLFMVSGGGDSMAPPPEPTLMTFTPTSDDDFKLFAKMVSDRCCALNDNPRKTGRYVDFVKELLRGLTKGLGPDDAKDLATFMGLIGNEKRDEFKKSKGYKKKNSKKAHVRVDRAADLRDDNFDDFADDFM